MIAAARRQIYGAPHSSPPRAGFCMVDFCVYLLYRAALAFIVALPLPAVFFLGKTLGFLAWLLLPNYRRLARRNVEIAFGNEKPAREIRRIVRRHFQQLGANLLSGASNRLRTAPDHCYSNQNSSTQSSGNCRAYSYDRRPLHRSSRLGQ